MRIMGSSTWNPRRWRHLPVMLTSLAHINLEDKRKFHFMLTKFESQLTLVLRWTVEMIVLDSVEVIVLWASTSNIKGRTQLRMHFIIAYRGEATNVSSGRVDWKMLHLAPQLPFVIQSFTWPFHLYSISLPQVILYLLVGASKPTANSKSWVNA